MTTNAAELEEGAMEGETDFVTPWEMSFRLSPTVPSHAHQPRASQLEPQCGWHPRTSAVLKLHKLQPKSTWVRQGPDELAA